MNIKFLSTRGTTFEVEAKAGCLKTESVDGDPRCAKRTIEVMFNSECWEEIPGAKAKALSRRWAVIDPKVWPSYRGKVCCTLERVEVTNGCRVKIGHLVGKGFECSKSEWLEKDGCCDAIVTLEESRVVEKHGAKFNEKIYKVKIGEMFDFTTDHIIKVDDGPYLKVSRILKGLRPGGLSEIEAIKTNHPRA